MKPCTLSNFLWDTVYSIQYNIHKINSMAHFICRPEEYKKKVAEYVKKYATEEALRDQCGDQVSNIS